MGKTLAPLLEQFVAERLASGKECSRSCGGKAEVVELRGSLKLYLARSLCKLCAEVDLGKLQKEEFERTTDIT